MYFNPYDVGKCLGLCDSSIRNYLAKMNENQAILLTNATVQNKDIRKLHSTGEKFLTESGVYKMAFSSNKSCAEEFANWVTDEVLPSINKTGSYHIGQEESEPYQYIPKTFRGEPVVTVLDITMKAGIARQKVRYHVRHCKRGIDYYSLNGAELAEFKAENPSFTRIANNMFVITKRGFLKLAKMISGLKQTEYFPKDVPQQISAPPALANSNKMYLNTPVNEKAQKVIAAMNRQLTAISVMLEQYNKYLKPDDQHSRIKVVNDLCQALFISCSDLERVPLKEVELDW